MVERVGVDEVMKEFSDLTREQIELASICVFDMGRSGAGLAWDYCFPNEERHWIANYVEDRDLWKFALPHSKEISSAMMSYPLTFESLDMLAGLGEANGIEMCRREGSAILRSDQTKIETIARKAREIEIAGYNVLSVNSSCLQSELGNKLCQGRAFSVIWHEIENGDRLYSLRSDKDGIDVSVVAKSLGGGGHANSSSFRLVAGKEL
jgi:oligoribonuclease NrnB/cAMP/cGMP phosphodiesterase (DHH superfamily)